MLIFINITALIPQIPEMGGCMRKGNSLRTIIAGTLALSMAACEFDDETKQAIEESFQLGEQEIPEIPAINPDPECFNERFVQPEAEVSRKIDILFVTDTSGSLNQERAGIADGIDSFVEQLPSEVDYQIGVLLGHGSRSSYSGKLYASNKKESVVLRSSEMELAKIRSELSQKLTRVKSDRSSDGGEEGLYSLTQALKSENLSKARAHGFFREDAALAVIYIADENDICARYPEGVVPVPDRDRLEGPAFKRDCSNVTEESVLQALKDHQGDQPLLVAGIVYNNLQTVPHGGENELGYGYLKHISLANGLTIDLADGRYDEGLAKIGTLASVKLRLIDEFTLARPEVDLDTLAVQVNGREVEFDFTKETNSVFLPEPGTALSVVDINYCLKSTEPEDEEGGDDEDGEDDDGEDDECTVLSCEGGGGGVIGQ